MKKNIEKIEEKFHDEWSEKIDVDKLHIDDFFEACTAPENRYIIDKIGNLKGKKLLELGCGAGEASVYLAKKGADVTATDLSGGMLRVVEKLASRNKVKVKTKKCPSYKLDFPDNYFDVVYAANLLHHVDIENTIKEVNRVLKNKGIFASWDPISHNPIINIYRRIASEVRTEDEHPLKMKDLKIFKKYFNIEYETTWFFTLWIFIKFYFFDKIDPNKERYWKKIIIEHKLIEKTYVRLKKIDDYFLKIFPFLKRFCWNIAIISYKKQI
ncbi:class I SAM-dependent methyltransferase [Spirochaetota bacterium]